MNTSRLASGLLALGLAGILAGCSADAASTEASSESSVTASQASSVAELRALVEEGRVMFDDVTDVAQGEVIDEQRTESSLGGITVDALVRVASGAVFNRIHVDTHVGTHGGDGAVFTDTRHFLVLDAAGLDHVARNGRKTAVRGDRLQQLQQVFDRTPHPSSPTEQLWGDNPFFAWPDGGEAVAFIGSLYVRSGGRISRYSLASDSFDPLDR